MKTKNKVLLLFLLVTLFTYAKNNNQIITNVSAANAIQEVTIVAVFDGHEDYGYNFITVSHDEEGEEHTVTFQKVNDDVLEAFDLKSEALIGSKFKVTYKVKVEVTKDENGFEDENEIYTITKLEKL